MGVPVPKSPYIYNMKKKKSLAGIVLLLLVLLVLSNLYLVLYTSDDRSESTV